jgi:hypothetical protein
VALVSAITASTAAAAGGSHNKVRGTASIAWLGPADFLQSSQGGASLFADGTMKGNIIASAPYGQIVLHVTPVSWSWLVPEYAVEFCQEVRIVKGPPLPLPPVFCDPVPVTGGPVLIEVTGDDHPDIMLRVNIF